MQSSLKVTIISTVALVGLPLMRTDARQVERVGATTRTTGAIRPALRAIPAELRMTGKYDEARVLIDEVMASTAHDVTDKVKWRSANPKIAFVDDAGVVRPKGDGSTVLVAEMNGNSARVSVTVTGIAKNEPPHFIRDVIPILTKAGCNSGACHGAGQGKGGLKISLQGYDPDFDFKALLTGGAARRINKTQPEMSLLLRKPALAVVHKGGLRLRSDSAEFRLMADWIGAGCPGPDPADTAVIGLDVTPALRTLSRGQTQRFRVVARYADGSTRDATQQTLFSASDEIVAKVSADGVATAAGAGEGAALVRYQSFVSTARVISPFANPKNASKVVLAAPSAPKSGTTVETASAAIDRFIDRKLVLLGLPSSPRSTDTDYLRRLTLDVNGILPTPEEVRAFLADKSPDKRAKMVEILLDRPEYVDFWTMKWGDILRSNRKFLNEKGLVAFNHWIRDSVAENKPWDQVAREVILARGNAFDDGPSNFFRTASDATTLAETTSQVFLGVRIQCARCHNHPYEKWKQDQYYQMAAFFARVKHPDQPGSPFVASVRGGEVTHLRTGKVTLPVALDARPVSKDFTGDRREALATWMTSPGNPFFSKELVNRVWKHFMGRGLVEPVDDLRVTNPPSNGELFDWLAADFEANGYNIRRLIQAITRTAAYHRTSEPLPTNATDGKYYSHYPFKRLGAEQLLDAISASTGVVDKFGGYPSGTRAAQLMDSATPSYFLELFGRPARNITCECERQDDPSLGQILHLMNNAGLNERIASKSGRLSKLLEAKTADAPLVEQLYLSTVSRLPSAAELKTATLNLSKAKNRQTAAEDLLWALLNSKEFFFNH